jgi:hypothetical protein
MSMPNGHRSLSRSLLGVTIALIALVLSVRLASAHEHKTVGDYTLTVGFLNEPSIDEQPNGLDFRVAQGTGDNAKPVDGLAATLKAEVKFGGQTMPLTLEPVFNVPGSYKANFIPTAPGTYTFHISGTINNTPIDETFTSGPDTFSDVEDASAMQFPTKVNSVASVSQTAQDANDTADSARLFGIIGIVVGVLGLIAGVTGMMMARGSRTKASVAKDRGEMGSSTN